MKRKLCPCTSGRPYRTCCGPLHRREQEAETPTLLMRSRFAAYALGEAEYLWRTLHDDHADRRRPEEDVLRDVRESARALRYLRLTILEAKEERVLFVAKVFQNGVDRSFIELSTFAREGSSWRYREGVARGLAGSSTTDWTIDSFEAATAGGS